MPGASRSLPDRPNLRYLKLEAKRRHAAGEFATLHDAQAALAREHGLPGWAALKHLIDGPAGDSPALARLEAVIVRFRGAGRPSWTPPDESELRQYFHERFLAETPPGELAGTIARLAPALREPMIVLSRTPLSAGVQVGELRIDASADADPPHRLTDVRAVPLARRADDPRVRGPVPARTLGDVPAGMAGLAAETFTELGVAGLLLAGGRPGAPVWAVARGWADLDRGEVLDPGHRFPASGVTALVTATAVLRLVGEGRFGLDDRANDHLRTVRVADDTVTVRELLAHTAGVAVLGPAVLFGDHVPGLVEVTGPVVACPGPRGPLRPSNGGYAVLGQLVADVTGSPYPEAATRLVLEPLGMDGASFPAGPAGAGAVTGYAMTGAGRFTRVAAGVCTVPAAGGLWAPPGDLVRLGLRWSSLLPPALAREALRPQSPASSGYRAALGWLIGPGGDVALHAGMGPGATASLLADLGDGRVRMILADRSVPLVSVHDRLLRPDGAGGPQRNDPRSESDETPAGTESGR